MLSSPTDRCVYLRSHCRRFLSAATPEVFRHQYAEGPLSKRTDQPTAWLTGVRGVAALIVFNWHYLFILTDKAAFAYGWENAHYSWYELPIFRLFMAGIPMVGVFFVVAGYANAVRPLALMHEAGTAGDWRADGSARIPIQAKLLQSLASSNLRRWCRLYLPCAVVMLCVAIVAQTGIYSISRPYLVNSSIWTSGTAERFIRTQPNLLLQLRFWLHELVSMSNLWVLDTEYPTSDGHLWTIRYEMRSSLCLSLLLGTTAICRPSARLAIMLVVGIWCLSCDRWAEPLYICGACIAQLRVMYDKVQPQEGLLSFCEEDPEACSAEKITSRSTYGRLTRLLKAGIKEVTWHSAFFLSLYLLSTSYKGWDTAWGYRTLASLSYQLMGTRRDRWLSNPGAVLFIALIDVRDTRSRYKAFFQHPWTMHTGRISFAFYILHGPILHLFGYMIPIGIWMLFGCKGQPESVIWYWVALGVGWVVSLAVTLAVADVFYREVECRLVRFTVWLEKKCTS